MTETPTSVLFLFVCIFYLRHLNIIDGIFVVAIPYCTIGVYFWQQYFHPAGHTEVFSQDHVLAGSLSYLNYVLRVTSKWLTWNQNNNRGLSVKETGSSCFFNWLCIFRKLPHPLLPVCSFSGHLSWSFLNEYADKHPSLSDIIHILT